MAPAASSSAPAISCNLSGFYQSKFNYTSNGKPSSNSSFSSISIPHKSRSNCLKQRRFEKGTTSKLCHSGNLIETLDFLQEEFKQKHTFDASVYGSRKREIGFLLKACVQQKDIVAGRKLHEIVKESDELRDDAILNAAIITMYSTCGYSSESFTLFDEMQTKRLCHWNAMLSAFTRNRLWFDAIALFIELFTLTDYKPDNFTLPCVIKACGEILGLGIGQAVHGISIKMGLVSDTFVANALITMYRRFRLVDDAVKVFEFMPERNLVSLNSFLCLLSDIGSIDECFHVLTVILMGEERLIPDVTTTITILSVCSEKREVELGKMVHSLAVKLGLSDELVVINALINMYSKCESLSEAQMLFDKNSSNRSIVSWNSLIGGYANNGDYLGFCFSLLRRMETELELEEVDEITILNILPACLEKKELSCVKELHGYSIRNGLLQKNEFLANAFVSAYARCDSLKSAENTFHYQMETKTVNSWNALIHCYAQNGEPLLALNTFRKMNLNHDQFTISSLLFALSSCKYLQPGKEIHGHVLRNWLKPDPFIMNSLLSFYFHCGKTLSARAVFDSIVEKSSISWNTVVSGYTQNGNPIEALALFREMLSIGVKPSDVSIKALLGACSKLSSLKLGKQIHCFALKAWLGLTEGTLVVPSLLDMYAKSGSIELAETIFHQTKYKDVVLCNVLISGYGNHGRGKEATEIFEEMTKWGLKPDGFTFMGVLIACNHAGMVEEGLEYFRRMKTEHHHEITAKLEHYACVVDMLGRAGRFEDATMIVSEMPMDPDVGMWSSIVSSCRKYGELELGKVVAGKLLESSICEEEAGNYALVCDLLAECGMWDDVRKVRRRMDELGIQKDKGESLIEIGSQLCSFVVGDNMSPIIE
ncbi:pentatricopeptide repeat-containing protein At1g18485 [Impatiens glandulifera]|uniref:pentatricopeptide repeat-containing protein At1g18485 n=1 Tax=Impatiens glandulifera TaxID=253017 RepID=UPI001FB0F60C|nr:pentatricopeptide repeat-containing protein At1g18485 [Impatiens glandulifera]